MKQRRSISISNTTKETVCPVIRLNTELSKPYKKQLRESSEKDCKYSYCDSLRKLEKGD